MKKLIILLIIFIFFLSGCGICNLNNFILPNDTEFLALVEELDEPEKIGNYMIDNFAYKIHDFYAPDPYTLWQIKKGDCNDFSTFGIFIADYHGYETYQIIISYINTSTKHMIAIYVENDGLSFSDCQIHSFYLKKTYFNTFKEIVEFDCEYYPNKILKAYIVYDYWNNIIKQVTNF